MISNDHLSPMTSRAELIGQTERQSISLSLIATALTLAFSPYIGRAEDLVRFVLTFQEEEESDRPLSIRSPITPSMADTLMNCTKTVPSPNLESARWQPNSHPIHPLKRWVQVCLQSFLHYERSATRWPIERIVQKALPNFSL